MGPSRSLFVQPFAHGGGSENVLLRLVGGVDPARVDPVVLMMEDGPTQHPDRCTADFDNASSNYPASSRSCAFPSLHADSSAG